ncbi:hypothetical protein A7979_03780 [Rothia nasimurium]|uniref:D-inositol 3-phosphate glycosyltransferase n=1 Tax=Rothia nasimurium TaxID=85336 RepID=A0A1Y1RNQ1_9MICC|nr:glycosyltransferase family 4 protein [Rothia nasimurium]ORC16452.1 hypothetical protein A7979_03780 [Rothia nasimurium]
MGAVIYLVRNTVLACGVVAGLMRTDPAAFIAQLTQRLPVTARRLAGPLLLRLAPKQDAARALFSAGQVSDALTLARTDGRLRLAAKLEAEAQLLHPTWRLSLPTAPTLTDAGQGAPASASHNPTAHQLRVLHLLTNSLPATQSGYTVRSHRLLKALAHRGVQLAVHTRIGYPVMVGGLTARDSVRVENLTYRRFLPWQLASTTTARLEQWAAHLARTYDVQPPQLIHTTTHFHNALVAQALAERWGIPWVYEVRGVLEQTWLSKQPPHLRKSAAESERFRLTRARETQMMRAAHRVVTLSETMKASLIERGLPTEKITVVPNSVDTALLEQGLSPQQARAQLGLPAHGFWVGSVSSLVPYEGFETLLRAVALLREQGADARVLLAGDGTSRVFLEELAGKLGLREAVLFLGRVTPERALIVHQALDVFAVPRTDDEVCRTVTPLKPVEAMALGRPVVVSDVPPLADLVCPAGVAPAGLTATPEDPESWAQALGALLRDEGARARLGAQGRALARERTWEEQSKAVTHLYTQLVNQCAPRPGHEEEACPND